MEHLRKGESREASADTLQEVSSIAATDNVLCRGVIRHKGTRCNSRELDIPTPIHVCEATRA